jgi:anthranilate phosphoribosyltransferase
MHDPEAFKPFVKAVGRGEKLKRDLTFDEAAAAFRMILQRTATDAQIGAFLIAQRVKGESVDEVLAFTQVARTEFMQPISPQVENLLDLAPPYDGKSKTAQLAPAVAILLAEAGVPTVLHGAEEIPTKAGITPGAVLAALGVAVDLPPHQVARQIEGCGVGYLAVRQFIPAWEALTPLRQQFGLRTVLNSVEKLLNPLNAPYQVSGFFHGNYIDRLRTTMTGTRQSWMVQGEEGSIEMAAGRKTHIFAVNEAEDVILNPAEVGLSERVRVEVGPDLQAHVRLNLAVLAGQPGDATDQVALTTAVILHLLGKTTDLTSGLRQVRELLASGAGERRLARWRDAL